ncbi:putative MSP1-intra-mitochondrial sorting protein [Rhodotorula toruloides]|uniref:BY PROTMAP: gi/472585383/gb/EMS22937.1/ ATPase,AAA-type domain containing protein [Rhodosporidium toruloides NP11] gi/647399506/emb/CDR44339.1/ RHTO0S09e02828g1_1 [Rhodosporidium toruloides] n=1 Tax=Rhodotorula toruloides TaxID=5286 RepID=A0A0K3CRT3_RHOTO|nr:putative MSP1-intra-mitochondrial sorting protein [Rhodotorula toruloides]
MPPSAQTKKLLLDGSLFILSQVAFYYAFKVVMNQMDPQKSKRKESKAKSKEALGKLGVDLSTLELSEHEEIIAGEVVAPEDIHVTFSDVGGLDPIISQLREAVIFPLCYPQLFESSAGLFGAPKGVLLYGPPGCGKTMLAKALARESGATFINMHVSTLTDKWQVFFNKCDQLEADKRPSYRFGESNKLVAALFSLARKLQPSIIFIDEIDSFLRERSRADHEVTGMMKAEFMSMWDGLTTTNDTRILVLGATNRPNDIDSAILRRMPKRFSIKLPDASQRRNILQLMLKDIKLDNGFDLEGLVRKTDGLSGSDLKEACRNAAMVPVREYMRQNLGTGGQIDVEKVKAGKFNIRPLRLSDFFVSDYAQTGTGGAMEQEGLD